MTAVLRIERLQRLDPAIALGVEALVQRSAVHERHSPIGEHKFVRLLQGDADAFGLVAHFDDRLAGYAQAVCSKARGSLASRLTAEVLVDPAYRGRGIGRTLVERLMLEAHRAGVERFDAWAHHADAAAIGLAERIGMRPIRQLWQMALQLDRVRPPHRRIPVPDDARLRTFRRGQDEQTLTQLIRDAFPDHPENAQFDAGDLAARVRLPWFDPETILIASDASSGDALGVHWTKLEPERGQGEVYILGVVPAAQGRGIGRVLLLEGLELMRSRGIGLAFLYVEAENEPAIALYRQAGFRHEHLDTCFSIEVPPREGARAS
jgi:mycothiol synthase